jgi:NOL1/NOP2/fmu family ribosome biogenesis protein
LPSWSRNRSAFEPQERSRIAKMWLDRFGTMQSVFDSYSFYRRAQNIWVFSNAALPKFSYEAVGLRMMNIKEEPWKPTTYALQIFGKYATKNFICLNEMKARCFLAGESQLLEANVEPGYIVVFYKGEVLGCALYSRGKLHSQLPKELRIGHDAEMKI